MTACSKDNSKTYTKQEVQISQRNSKKNESPKQLQINGLYTVKSETFMYSDKNEDTKYDSLEEGSIIFVLMEEEEGFVFVNYNGNQGYIKIENINR